MAGRRRRRGRGREAWGPGEHPARQTPSRKGFGFDTQEEDIHQASPPSLPPKRIQGGLATSLCPKPSLRSPWPFSPSVHLPSQRADWPPASPLICFSDCHCARLSAYDAVRLPVGRQASRGSGQVGCPSVCQSVHRSCSLFRHQVSLSVLPVVRRPPSLSSTYWSVCSLTVFLVRPAAHLSFSACAFPLSTCQGVTLAFLSVCPSVNLVLPTPHSSPCVETALLITKTHLCLPWTRAGWPPVKQSRQASQPRAAPPQPSSSRVPTPSLHSTAAPFFWLPHPLSQPWNVIERFSRRYLGKTRFKLMVKIRFYDSISVLFLDRFSPLALSINSGRLFSAVFMVMQVNV